MNIKNMSDDQALAVLLLATTVMDGKIEESELGAVLVLFCTTTGKTPDQGGPIVLEMAEKVLKGGTDVMSGAIIQATEVVKRRYSRDKLIALVKAMMGISKSDGDISMPEAQWIGAVMTNLGITLDDLI